MNKPAYAIKRAPNRCSPSALNNFTVRGACTVPIQKSFKKMLGEHFKSSASHRLYYQML